MENLLFKAIVGSQSYGTSTPQSDIDYKGVYKQNINEVLGINTYKQQVEVSKDEVYFEVKRFIELLTSANPTVIELLYSPKDCILHATPEFQLIVENRDVFLTKQCLNSFGGYAVAQIKKARGLDKKMNWEMDRVKRKTPLDFIYCYTNGKTLPVKKWLEINKLEQEKCGLVGLSHFRDGYALYYDHDDNLNFKGIVLDKSNSVRLSSVPKGIQSETVVYFNKEGYSQHCKDYHQFQTWLENRNTQRYVDNMNHNQKIDGKNMMHCRRLIDMAIEIAQEGTINVRRPNADYLLSIRRGEVNLDELLTQAEENVLNLDELFANSSLPDTVDMDFVNNLLITIRNI